MILTHNSNMVFDSHVDIYSVHSKTMNVMTKLSRMTTLSMILIIVISYSSLEVDAYITATAAVPPTRQMEWLKQMTVDICQSKEPLSNVQVSQSRDLMYEWSHNPKLFSLCSANDECAIAVESLLKRVVDEQKSRRNNSGNDKASLSSSSTSSSPLKIQAPAVQYDSARYPLVDLNVDVSVTVHDYNCVLEGWARSAASSGTMAAERCEQILEAMMKYGPYPNIASFKACLMAWKQTMGTSTTGTATATNNGAVVHAPYRAQRILELMMRLSETPPTTPSKELLFPDADCFDIVLQTWSRSNDPNAPERTEQLLMKMDRLYRKSGKTSLKPRRTSLNAVLTSWFRQAPYKAIAANRSLSILEFMEHQAKETGDTDIAPDTVSYKIVMNALASSQTSSGDLLWSARKADELIRHVVDLFNTQQIVTTKMNTNHPLIRSEVVSKGNNEMIYESKIIPDTILFNTVMGLWGKVRHGKSRIKPYVKAKSILDLQTSLYESRTCRSCKPDVVSYTSVIVSCCSTFSSSIPTTSDSQQSVQRKEAFDIALSTYRRMQALHHVELHKYIAKYQDKSPNRNALASMGAPNHVTYGAILKACLRLMPIDCEYEQVSLIKEIFSDCCSNGYVSDKILARLQEGTSTILYNELMNGCITRDNKIPYEWNRNVPDRECELIRNVLQQRKTSSSKSYNNHNNNNNKHGSKRKNNSISSHNKQQQNRKRAEV